jgi:hypothetical protein
VVSATRRGACDRLINAAGVSSCPAAVHLVGHRIGQTLDRLIARYPVAVQVQEGVQLAQGEPAMAGEDSEAGRSEPAAAHQLMGVGERWWWLVPVPWGTAALAPLDSRPEAFASFVERGNDLPPARGQGFELSVENGHLCEERFALGMEPDALMLPETGLPAHGEPATVW